MIKVVYIYDHFIRKNEMEIIEGADLLISDWYIEINNFLNLSQIEIDNRLDTSKLEELSKKYNNIVICSSIAKTRFNYDLMKIADKINFYVRAEAFEEYRSNMSERINEFKSKIEYKWGNK